MNNSTFFALAFRMKYIKRWGLMHCTVNENLCEHSAETAILAHALATIGNNIFGKNYDTDRASTLALYHDLCEVYTGDMPTPIKYYNDDIKKSFKEIEKVAQKKLISKLPRELEEEFEKIVLCKDEDAELLALVKAADKLSAYIKCLMEQKMGNTEFDTAIVTIKSSLDKIQLPELTYFMENMLDSFFLTLDEL